jgi:lysozyme
MMRTSRNGLNHIKQYEGFSATAYQDVAGLWTIGYGHLIKSNENHLHSATLTEEQAIELLAQDVRTAEQAVRANVVVELNQNQFDALVSLVFNIGSGAFSGSTVLSRINVNESVERITEAWLRWNKARVNGQLQVVPGLVNRRESEIELYFSALKKKSSNGNDFNYGHSSNNRPCTEAN